MDHPTRSPDLDQVPFFDAFLSYSSKDGKPVAELAARLVQDGFDVFLDSWFIRPGHSIPRMIPAALRKSRTVLALVTPSYFQSPWAEFELNWNFVETHVTGTGGAAPLIPVIIQGCDIPKEIAGLRQIDLGGDRWEAGYRDLVQALSHVDSLVIDSYVLPSSTETAYLIEFVTRKLRRLYGFADPRLDDLTRVYLELTQNAFQHVSHPKNRVEVRVKADARQATLEVSDTGGGFDLPAELRRRRRAIAEDPASPGGRGLVIVDAICDRLSNAVNDRRHVVTAVVYREKASARLDGSGDERVAEGAWLLKSVDPEGRYAHVRITRKRLGAEEAAPAEHFLGRTVELDRFQTLIVDLSAVEYMSSNMLRVLMTLRRQILAASRSCVLVVVGDLLLEILRISGLHTLFPVFRSFEDALKKLRVES